MLINYSIDAMFMKQLSFKTCYRLHFPALSLGGATLLRTRLSFCLNETKSMIISTCLNNLFLSRTFSSFFIFILQNHRKIPTNPNITLFVCYRTTTNRFKSCKTLVRTSLFLQHMEKKSKIKTKLNYLLKVVDNPPPVLTNQSVIDQI